MDVVLKTRANNHLKKLFARRQSMSIISAAGRCARLLASRVGWGMGPRVPVRPDPPGSPRARPRGSGLGLRRRGGHRGDCDALGGGGHARPPRRGRTRWGGKLRPTARAGVSITADFSAAASAAASPRQPLLDGRAGGGPTREERPPQADARLQICEPAISKRQEVGRNRQPLIDDLHVASLYSDKVVAERDLHRSRVENNTLTAQCVRADSDRHLAIRDANTAYD
eukprot:1488552-Prymnesium_polylepis.1